MRRVSMLLLFLSLFTFVLAPHSGFSIGRKPKQETHYETPAVKQTQPKPSARDMQVATGEIPPIDEEEKR